jgi:hypothetical protein
MPYELVPLPSFYTGEIVCLKAAQCYSFSCHRTKTGAQVLLTRGAPITPQLTGRHNTSNGLHRFFSAEVECLTGDNLRTRGGGCIHTQQLTATM